MVELAELFNFFLQQFLIGASGQERKTRKHSILNLWVHFFFLFTEYHFSTVGTLPKINPQIKLARYLWLFKAVAYNIKTQLNTSKCCNAPILTPFIFSFFFSFFAIKQELFYPHYSTQNKRFTAAPFHLTFLCFSLRHMNKLTMKP